MSITIEIEKNTLGAISLPLTALDSSDTREFKIKVVGDELIIYPAHLKFYEVATPQQRANLLLERLSHEKSDPNAPQIPDEALRRKNIYE
jgi:hypothetical protein